MPATSSPHRIVAQSGKPKLRTFALVWNGFAWAFTFVWLYLAIGEKSWDGVFVVPVFALSGLVLLWMAFKGVLHERRFGRVALVLEDEAPVRLGGRLHGRLMTQAQDQPADGFRVRLHCVHRTARIRYAIDSDGDRRREQDVDEDLLWSAEQRVRGIASDTGLNIPILFDLPEGGEAAASTLSDTDLARDEHEGILWRVHVDAELPGLDFDVTTVLPVAPPAEETAEPAADKEEGSFFDLREDSGAFVVDAEEQAAREAAEAHAAHTVERDVQVVLREAGVEVEQRGVGLRLHARRGRFPLAGLASLAAGLGCVAAVIFLPAIGCLGNLILPLFAMLGFYGFYRLMLFASTVQVGGGHIIVERGGPGWSRTHTLACTPDTEVHVSSSSNSGDRHYYELYLAPGGAAGQQAQVQHEASLQGAEKIMDSLGADEAARQRSRRTLRQQTGRQKLVGGLPDRQAADWLAAALRRAIDEGSL